MLALASDPLDDVIHLDFAPDPKRARALDRRMRAALADSLQQLGSAAPEVVDARVAPIIAGLQQGERYRPDLFADYYDLVRALLAGDDLEAEALVASIAGAQPACFRVLSLRETARERRYQLAMEEDGAVGLLQPDRAQIETFQTLFRNTRTLLGAGSLAALAGEIDALVLDLILVRADRTRPLMFEGGSHYQLWGALFLNIDRPLDRVGLIESLAHESAHSFLHGCCIDETLTLNSPTERFASPLRPDPRPMEGIFHAVFVTARMHWALNALLGARQIDAAERLSCKARLAALREAFAGGAEVLSKHGRLSRTGAALLDGAKAHMAEAG